MTATFLAVLLTAAFTGVFAVSNNELEVAFKSELESLYLNGHDVLYWMNLLGWNRYEKAEDGALKTLKDPINLSNPFIKFMVEGLDSVAVRISSTDEVGTLGTAPALSAAMKVGTTEMLTDGDSIVDWKCIRSDGKPASSWYKKNYETDEEWKTPMPWTLANPPEYFDKPFITVDPDDQDDSKDLFCRWTRPEGTGISKYRTKFSAKTQVNEVCVNGVSYGALWAPFLLVKSDEKAFNYLPMTIPLGGIAYWLNAEPELIAIHVYSNKDLSGDTRPAFALHVSDSDVSTSDDHLSEWKCTRVAQSGDGNSWCQEADHDESGWLTPVSWEPVGDLPDRISNLDYISLADDTEGDLYCRWGGTFEPAPESPADPTPTTETITQKAAEAAKPDEQEQEFTTEAEGGGDGTGNGNANSGGSDNANDDNTGSQDNTDGEKNEEDKVADNPTAPEFYIERITTVLNYFKNMFPN